jgi:peptide/nickel transport system permease protein
MTAVARAIAVLLGVAILSWVCVEAAPGSAGERAAQAAGLLPAGGPEVPQQTRDAIVREVAARYGLDRPFAARLAESVARLFVLDFGMSWRDGEPVRARVVKALGPTLLLIAGALALALALGVGAGLVAVARPGPVDVAISAVAAAAIAVPPVWVALLALDAFSSGATSGGVGLVAIASLAIVPAFILARYARAALFDAVGAPWAVAVRARGASQRRLVVVHALRASLAGLVGVAVTLVAYLIGGSLVIERVFGIRGIGALMVDASARGDAPVVVGTAITAGAILALVSLAADAAQRGLDPRLRDREDGGGA